MPRYHGCQRLDGENGPVIEAPTEQRFEERDASDAQRGQQTRFVLARGKRLHPPRDTRKDGTSIIRTLVVVKDRPGEHEGESRDIHPATHPACPVRVQKRPGESGRGR
jgi:hypothetical protein